MRLLHPITDGVLRVYVRVRYSAAGALVPTVQYDGEGCDRLLDPWMAQLDLGEGTGANLLQGTFYRIAVCHERDVSPRMQRCLRSFIQRPTGRIRHGMVGPRCFIRTSLFWVKAGHAMFRWWVNSGHLREHERGSRMGRVSVMRGPKTVIRIMVRGIVLIGVRGPSQMRSPQRAVIDTDWGCRLSRFRTFGTGPRMLLSSGRTRQGQPRALRRL